MYPLKYLPLENLFTSVRLYKEFKEKFCKCCKTRKKKPIIANIPLETPTESPNKFMKQKNIIKSGDLLLNQMIQRSRTNQGM